MAIKKVQPFDSNRALEYMSSLFQQTSICPSKEQLEQLTSLVDMLNTWNGALNLTAITQVNQMILLHILDSAVLSPVLSQVEPNANIADVGTGAGFPGLVLAILNPDKQFTLIDSVGKKLSFVRQVVAKLSLKNVSLINKRCEEITDQSFDIIVSRAFAPLARMVGWCLPLLSQKGHFVAMKAQLEQDELEQVPSSVQIVCIEDLHVPTLDATRKAVILKHA